MPKKEYHAITDFLDAKQRRVKLNQSIPGGRYDEVTIKHYLGLKMIAPGSPPITPENKAKVLTAINGMDQADPERKDEALWTKGGAPEVRAINAKLKDTEAGFTVDAAERDDAWVDYLKATTGAE